jgi:hypothetical protein
MCLRIITRDLTLGRARCFTPVDIIERLSSINGIFELQGAKKFLPKTLKLMSDIFHVSSSTQIVFAIKILNLIKKFLYCFHSDIEY